MLRNRCLQRFITELLLICFYTMSLTSALAQPGPPLVKSVAQMPPTPEPLQNRPPLPADITESPDLQLTLGIRALVASLNNIPARYVYGVIEVPAARLQSLLDVSDIDAAQSLLTQAGCEQLAHDHGMAAQHPSQ